MPETTRKRFWATRIRGLVARWTTKVSQCVFLLNISNISVIPLKQQIFIQIYTLQNVFLSITHPGQSPFRPGKSMVFMFPSRQPHLKAICHALGMCNFPVCYLVLVDREKSHIKLVSEIKDLYDAHIRCRIKNFSPLISDV